MIRVKLLHHIIPQLLYRPIIRNINKKKVINKNLKYLNVQLLILNTFPYWLMRARMSIALVPRGKLFTSKLALPFFSFFEDKSMQQICTEDTLTTDLELVARQC